MTGFIRLAMILLTVVVCLTEASASGRRHERSGLRPEGALARRNAHRQARPRQMALRRAQNHVLYSGTRVLPPPRPAPPDLPDPVPPAVSQEARGAQPSGPRAPHNMGVGGPYAYETPNPPPVGLSRRARFIQEEFLDRIEEKKRAVGGAAPDSVRAARPDKIGRYNPENPGDGEILVLDAADVPDASAGHNRDQGGKPSGGGKGKKQAD